MTLNDVDDLKYFYQLTGESPIAMNGSLFIVSRRARDMCDKNTLETLTFTLERRVTFFKIEYINNKWPIILDTQL